MKQKVLILGATGMAGHVVYYYLQQTNCYELSNIVFRTKLTADSEVVDVTNREEIAKAILNVRPDVIVNCIGVLIKGSRENPANAILINAYFPHLLEQLAKEINARLIHVSTDCVFSGKKGQYRDTDFRDADDVYGRSKALGEIVNAKDLTVRTSIIGPEIKKTGEGLFHWFMHQKGQVNGFDSAVWSGVTTIELAKAIHYLIARPEYVGLLQLGNGLGITKYDLLGLFKEIWHREDIQINHFDGVKVDKSFLQSERLEYAVPGYRQMLCEMYEWMKIHSDLYADYYSDETLK